MEQIIGIDLAKRVVQVHIVSTQGEKKANKMITREKLMAFIAQQPSSRIVMEACGSAITGPARLRHSAMTSDKSARSLCRLFEWEIKTTKMTPPLLLRLIVVQVCATYREKALSSRIFSVCTGFASG